MLKSHLNTLIANLKKASMVAKVTPWLNEGIGDTKTEIRYVGLKLSGDWLELFSDKDNLLLKFIQVKQTAQLEIYLANTPPFFKIYSLYLRDSDKWETILGEFKRRLKKDKAEAMSHQAKIDNLWIKLQPYLKNKNPTG